MTDPAPKPALPDHLSTDPKSPFFNEAVLQSASTAWKKPPSKNTASPKTGSAYPQAAKAKTATATR
jgi:hypothetical protein